MTDLDHLIDSGALPPLFAWEVEHGRGAVEMARLYHGRTPHTLDYDGFCRMWWGVAWVRFQAFEREYDARADAADAETWL